MSIENVKDILGHIRGIINTPVSNLMLLVGFLLIIASFLEIDGLEYISFTGPPKLTLVVIGGALLIGSPLLYAFTGPRRQTVKKLTTK